MTAAPENRRWWIFLGGSLAILMFTIDASIVNVALPILAKEFQSSLAVVQWVILSYSLLSHHRIQAMELKRTERCPLIP
ncbi:hypothetical protein RYO59_001436 [Thermosynechococcaceae cyanobacterium Okahandja]